jgi:hypothetical protein
MQKDLLHQEGSHHTQSLHPFEDPSFQGETFNLFYVISDINDQLGEDVPLLSFLH